MHPGEPILLICHSFPPNSGIGGRRWAKFAKELARRGHPVHVIRNSTPHEAATSLWSDDVDHANIIAHPLPDHYPGVMFRWPTTTLGEKLRYWISTHLLPLSTKGNWYDRGIFWRGPMLQLARKLIQEHSIRNVVVTGAPFSLMAYATELKETFPDINLIGDFRDMWTWGNYYGYQTIGEKRLRHERQLEALVAEKSDKLISPHPAVLEYLGRTYGIPASRMTVLAHAVDPEDMPTSVAKAADGIFRMIYAGSLYGGPEADRYFRLVLDAFEQLRKTSPDRFNTCRFDLYITDHGTAALEHQVKERGLDQVIRFHAPLPPKAIFSRIAEADLAMAFLPQEKKDLMVTKFAEISYLHCPILHVGEPGTVSRTLQTRRLGDSIRVDEMVVELPRIIRGERTIKIDRDIDQSGDLLGHITDQLLQEVLV